MRRDRRERPRRGGRERDTGSAEEDGNVQHRMPCRMACHDQRHDGVRTGACRPRPPRPDAGARVGPRRAPRAVLISKDGSIRQHSAASACGAAAGCRDTSALAASGDVGQKASRRGKPRAKVARISALTCDFFPSAGRKPVIATCGDAVRIEPAWPRTPAPSPEGRPKRAKQRANRVRL